MDWRIAPEQLKSAGRALYGDQWQSALARDLGVGSRRVREWMALERSIPAGVGLQICTLLKGRSQLMADLAQRIERESAP